MSARKVCSGTRPSRYHSLRAISEPPRRPEHWTRMPRAPAFCAVCTARFMARRKLTRPVSWSHTAWAVSDASGELVSPGRGDQPRVQLGLLDLLDVQLDLGVVGDLGQVGAQAVGLGPT